MGQPEAPSVTTRLQARVDAHDEKLLNLTNEVRTLSTTVFSMQEMLNTFPENMEKLITNLLKQHGKQPHLGSTDDGSVHTETSGSGLKTPHRGTGVSFRLDNFDDPPFSLPKVKLPLFEGNALSALIPDQSKEQPIGMFLRGLKNELRNWVRALNPASCNQALEFARHVSTATALPSKKMNKFKAVASTGRYTHFTSIGRETPKTDSFTKPNSFTSYAKPIPPTGPSLPKAQNNLTTSPIQYLTKHEWKDRRHRGLCFGCGQKYHP